MRVQATSCTLQSLVAYPEVDLSVGTTTKKQHLHLKWHASNTLKRLIKVFFHWDPTLFGGFNLLQLLQVR
jgi:hypothetical protein